MADQQPLYLTWAEGDEQGKARALAGMSPASMGAVILRGQGEGPVRMDPLGRAQARDTFRNAAPNVHVREGFDREDYDYFRPNARIPTDPREIIRAGMQAYEKIGVVHNIVDMMSDFVTQGVDLVHPVARHEEFYREWFYRVRGNHITERAANLLYRCGQFFSRRMTAIIPQSLITDFRKGRASEVCSPASRLAARSADLDYESPPEPPSGEIPFEYVFLNPLTLRPSNPALSFFGGPGFQTWEIEIPAPILRLINQPATPAERQAVDTLPPGWVREIRQGRRSLPIDPETLAVGHYKKDDWQPWARPMTHCVLTDLQALQKMKLADLAALDGAILRVRLWRLGDLKERIFASPAAFERLANVLLNNAGGASLDLIWGPELDFKESSVDVHQFLGEAKYRPVLDAIFGGLGVPPSLTGSPKTPGFTNNAVSLKTLIERLQYGRLVITAFWDCECRRVQRAMGFREPARVVFDQQTLSDEATERRLLIELYDRNLISEEVVQERFGMIPEIERVRRRRERKWREAGRIPPRASPFLEHREALEKLFAGQGEYSPSQFGLDLVVDKDPPGKPSGPPLPGPTPGEPGKGRPGGRKDGIKRSRKVVRPRTALSFIQAVSQARQLRAAIQTEIQPAYLASQGKASLRELSTEQAQGFHQLTFALLCQHRPGEDLVPGDLPQKLSSPLTLPAEVDHLVRQVVSRQTARDGKPPTLEQTRQIEDMACAAYWISSSGEW